MSKAFFVLLTIIFSSCGTTYYVVRHGEKETSNMNMISDVNLSPAGKERAKELKDILIDKDIRHIFSTNMVRTKTTAQPLSDALQIPVQTYNATDTAFVKALKKGMKGNVLIVGHSNTVDNVVNIFLNKTLLQDLPETEYNNLFIIKKNGNTFRLIRKTYGK